MVSKEPGRSSSFNFLPRKLYLMYFRCFAKPATYHKSRWDLPTPFKMAGAAFAGCTAQPAVFGRNGFADEQYNVSRSRPQRAIAVGVP